MYNLNLAHVFRDYNLEFPMHMVIREIIPGRQQRVRRCPP